jgi:hypothetical protein
MTIPLRKPVFAVSLDLIRSRKARSAGLPAQGINPLVFPQQRGYALPLTSPASAPAHGEVAEWSIAPHSKCGVRASVPGVRIPPSPPFYLSKIPIKSIF